MEKDLRSLMARKGFRTLSRARREEVLSQLRLRNQAANQPQNKLISSNEYQKTWASASWRTRLMMSLVKWASLPKAIFLWARYRIMKKLLDFRNKPMKILIHPDSRLKRIAEPVDFQTTSIEERTDVVRKMGVALNSQKWGQRLGIAAPQIGMNKRVVIVRGNVMFNPEWNPSKAPSDTITEGCYSLPGKTFKVKRAPYGWAKWTNIEGKPFEDKLSGLPAIVFQHEFDHLNGKCCADVGEENTVEESPR